MLPAYVMATWARTSTLPFRLSSFMVTSHSLSVVRPSTGGNAVLSAGFSRWAMSSWWTRLFCQFPVCSALAFPPFPHAPACLSVPASLPHILYTQVFSVRYLKLNGSRPLPRSCSYTLIPSWSYSPNPLILDCPPHSFPSQICSVENLKLKDLAPGGTVGRLVIWTQCAFEKLESVYGSFTSPSEKKKGYLLPRPILANPDVTRVLSSEEVQVSREIRLESEVWRS